MATDQSSIGEELHLELVECDVLPEPMPARGTPAPIATAQISIQAQIQDATIEQTGAGPPPK